jgi:anthranilate synthase component 1
MIYQMTEKEFLELSKKGNLVPVYREVYGDLETPVAAYMKLASGARYSVLLESVEGGEKLARYSFLAKDPELVFRTKDRMAQIIRYKGKKALKEDRTFVRNPLEVVRELISKYNYVNIPALPRFCGGLVGYLSYDTVRFFERIPDNTTDDLGLPDIVLMLVKDMVIFDHLHHTIKVVSCVEVGRSDSYTVKARKFRQALRKIDGLIAELDRPLKKEKKTKVAKPSKLTVRSNCSKQEFEDMVSCAKRDIFAGEIIQAVLSQRFEVDIPKGLDEVKLYRTLRALNPSPYMYLLNLDDVKVVGSSPEMLVRCEQGVIQTRPIAGTRPRGQTPEEDEALEQELLKDPKEIAEHVMLVDLGRNDLGRVCREGTVEVTDLMTVERYSHVMHIVSNVQGGLKPEHDAVSALEAVFPAGTLSGAPKIRAMEIIDELEKTRRGPYGGCVGYFSFSQDLDTCITIRTVVLTEGKAYIQSGAGIVIDSDPAKEYAETVNKAKAQVRALELAQQR